MQISAITLENSSSNIVEILKQQQAVSNNIAQKKVEDKKEAPIHSFSTQRNISSINENIDVNNIYSSNEASNALLKEMDKQQGINKALKEESKQTKNELISGIAEGALAFFYGPEDLREVKSAIKQTKALIKGEEFIKDYDYKKAQHPFSFFRGSILHEFMNPFKRFEALDRLGDFGRNLNDKISHFKIWLLDRDKSLMETNLGKYFKRNFSIETNKIKTEIKDIQRHEAGSDIVDALKFKTNNKFLEITARALTRTSTLGLVADGVVNTIEAVEDIKSGEKIIPAIAESTANFLISNALVSTLGAIGSKYGPLGSLGSITLANHISNQIEKTID